MRSARAETKVGLQHSCNPWLSAASLVVSVVFLPAYSYHGRAQMPSQYWAERSPQWAGGPFLSSRARRARRTRLQEAFASRPSFASLFSGTGQGTKQYLRLLIGLVQSRLNTLIARHTAAQTSKLLKLGRVHFTEFAAISALRPVARSKMPLLRLHQNLGA